MFLCLTRTLWVLGSESSKRLDVLMSDQNIMDNGIGKLKEAWYSYIKPEYHWYWDQKAQRGLVFLCLTRMSWILGSESLKRLDVVMSDQNIMGIEVRKLKEA